MGLFSKRRRTSRASATSSLLKWFGPGATILGLLYAGFMLISGNWNFASLDQMLGSESGSALTAEPISLESPTTRPKDRIRIATFNIEKFGETKSTKGDEGLGIVPLQKIAEIVSGFDLVAIQELMGKDGAALARLVDLLNRSGGAYAGKMSDPLGLEDSTYRESYAFIWDRRRLDLVPGSAYVVRDPGKRMHREPMVATFQVKLPPDQLDQPFRFTVINVHTDPDVVDPNDPTSEINVLADVFRRVREYEFARSYEDDFILLGDLNVTPSKLGQLAQIPNIASLAGDIKTNVNRTKTNDHILIDSRVTREYANRMGVIDFQNDLKLSAEQANAISDHLPLWAEFSMVEATPPAPASVAASPSSATSR